MSGAAWRNRPGITIVWEEGGVTSQQGDIPNEQWDIFVTHHGFSADPLLFTFMNATYPGWWDSPEKHAALIRSLGSKDGNVLLFNVHMSIFAKGTIEIPDRAR